MFCWDINEKQRKRSASSDARSRIRRSFEIYLLHTTLLNRTPSLQLLKLIPNNHFALHSVKVETATNLVYSAWNGFQH